MVWGGRRLQQLLDKPITSTEPHGESWEVSDHALHGSVVANGPWHGYTLRHLMETKRRELLGPATGRFQVFPWLIKFLDASDWLSVQVHPDESSVVRLLPGEGSKTEAWFVMDAAPGSRIYAGLLPGSDQASLRAALAAGTVADCLHSFEPRPGDCIFLPAGTVHAVGGGVLMAEVQQTSDATFRLFDWNRRDAHGKSRTLHIEESLASIHWTRGPVQPIRVAGFRHDAETGQSTIRRALVQCPFFHLDYLQSAEPFSAGGTGRLQTLVVLQGNGLLATTEADELVATGQVWVLPAAMPPCQFFPRDTLKVLMSTLP
jgi:mannose-6-phosphate isomerase